MVRTHLLDMMILSIIRYSLLSIYHDIDNNVYTTNIYSRGTDFTCVLFAHFTLTALLILFWIVGSMNLSFFKVFFHAKRQQNTNYSGKWDTFWQLKYSSFLIKSDQSFPWQQILFKNLPKIKEWLSLVIFKEITFFNGI